MQLGRVVLAAGHVEGETVQEALDVIVTVEGKAVIVVVAVQLCGVVDDVDEATELEVEDNMHEQPELNFEMDTLQEARKLESRLSLSESSRGTVCRMKMRRRRDFARHLNNCRHYYASKSAPSNEQ